MPTSLKSELGTYEDTCEVYERLIQIALEHPGYASARMLASYQRSLAHYQQLAAEARAARRAAIQREEPVIDPLADPNTAHQAEATREIHPLMQSLLDTTALAYGVKVRR